MTGNPVEMNYYYLSTRLVFGLIVASRFFCNMEVVGWTPCPPDGKRPVPLKSPKSTSYRIGVLAEINHRCVATPEG